MLHNWTIEQAAIITLKGKDWEFTKDKNPHDLTEIISEPWVKDAIARGYFVENTSQNTSEDSAPNSELIG